MPALSTPSTPFMIAVTGGSGSGKTYFIRQLMEKIPAEQVTIISQDHYYRKREMQPKDERGIENFDTPESIDYLHFAQDIAALKAGKKVEKLEYTFNNPNLVPQTLVFKPNPIVIVEGIFVLHYPEIASQTDLKIFVDAADHIKLKRRLLRDQRERGYDLDDVLYRFEHHVMPAYERYIAPQKSHADLVVNNHKSFDKALPVIVAFIFSLVNGGRS